MQDFQTLGEVATVHRGIEWSKPLTMDRIESGYRTDLVRKSVFRRSHIGIVPSTPLKVLEVPEMGYLDVKEQNMKGDAFLLPWSQPKAIVYKSTKSCGRWRMAAFPDTIGVICDQNHMAVWSASRYDEWILSAILNSPVANVFVCIHERNKDTDIRNLHQIPVPNITEHQSEKIRILSRKYQRLICPDDNQEMVDMLMIIDAIILDGFRMPARMERKILEFLRGHQRAVPFKFPAYFERDFDMYFNLSEYLSADFRLATAGELYKRMSS